MEILNYHKDNRNCRSNFWKMIRNSPNFWTITVILAVVVSTGSELPTTWKSRSRSFEGVYCVSLVPPVAYTPCYASQCYCSPPLSLHKP